MLERPAFSINLQNCTGCKTCIIACKDKNNLGQAVRWRRVVEVSGGDWQQHDDGTYTQQVFAYYVSLSCNHCEAPICVRTCPTTAMHKDKQGIVTVDPSKCIGCRYCEWACPYSAPQFDSQANKMTKCDLCQDNWIKIYYPPAWLRALLGPWNLGPMKRCWPIVMTPALSLHCRSRV